MVEQLLRLSLRHRWLVLFSAAALIVLGVYRVRSMPVDDLLASGFIIAATARVVFLGVFGTLMLLLVSGPWAMVATIALSLIPRMFQHVLTPTADVPMLIPLTLGAATLIAGVVTNPAPRRRLVIILSAGLLLGAAGLLRQHALALAAGVALIGWHVNAKDHAAAVPALKKLLARADVNVPLLEGVVQNLEENGLTAMELHLTLYAPPSVGPLRIRRLDFNFSGLGEAKLDHSLDNFIVLLEKLVATFPDAWNAGRARRFLDDMDPMGILYFKAEEAQNFDRWMLQWVAIEARERERIEK